MDSDGKTKLAHGDVMAPAVTWSVVLVRVCTFKCMYDQLIHATKSVLKRSTSYVHYIAARLVFTRGSLGTEESLLSCPGGGERRRGMPVAREGATSGLYRSAH